MLYVFLVDTGAMFNFDMNMTLESVSCLQDAIASTAGIPPDKQVLLVSGGESLDPETRVCQYSAGTETNPIFLFSANRPQLVVDLGTEQQRLCESAVHEQHLQQQGWAAVVANLDDVISAADITRRNFLAEARHFVKQSEVHLSVINKFDLAIQELEHVPLVACFAKANVTTLSDWISDLDPNFSLTQTSEQCRRGLSVFTEELVDEMSECITVAIESANDESMKYIRGLEDRLCSLEQLMVNGKKLVQEQRDFAQGMVANQDRMTSLKDQSVLPNLCTSHQGQLLLMGRNHQQLRGIRKKCILAKEELGVNIHRRLRLVVWIRHETGVAGPIQKFVRGDVDLTLWVVHVQKQICLAHNQLLLQADHLKRLKKYINVISQVYAQSVAEVVRRRAYYRVYRKWSSFVVAQSKHQHSLEVGKRSSFRASISPRSHFLLSMFGAAIDDQPHAIDVQPIEKYDDDRLPEITLDDLENLIRCAPRLAEEMRLKDTVNFARTFSMSSPPTTSLTSFDTLGVSTDSCVCTDLLESTVNVEPSIANTEPSTVNVEPSIANTEPSIVSVEPSIANSEPLMAISEPSIANVEPSIANVEPSKSTEGPSFLPNTALQVDNPNRISSNLALSTIANTCSSLDLVCDTAPSVPPPQPIDAPVSAVSDQTPGMLESTVDIGTVREVATHDSADRDVCRDSDPRLVSVTVQTDPDKAVETFVSNQRQTLSQLRDCLASIKLRGSVSNDDFEEFMTSELSESLSSMLPDLVAKIGPRVPEQEGRSAPVEVSTQTGGEDVQSVTSHLSQDTGKHDPAHVDDSQNESVYVLNQDMSGRLDCSGDKRDVSFTDRSTSVGAQSVNVDQMHSDDHCGFGCSMNDPDPGLADVSTEGLVLSVETELNVISLGQQAGSADACRHKDRYDVLVESISEAIDDEASIDDSTESTKVPTSSSDWPLQLLRQHILEVGGVATGNTEEEVVLEMGKLRLRLASKELSAKNVNKDHETKIHMLEEEVVHLSRQVNLMQGSTSTDICPGPSSLDTPSTRGAAEPAQRTVQVSSPAPVPPPLPSSNCRDAVYVSVRDFRRGDIALAYFNTHHRQFMLFVSGTSNLFFIHSESLPKLPNLVATCPPVLVNVLEKEYCQAKKSTNRFNVSVGTKFFRIKVSLFEMPRSRMAQQ